MASAAWAAETYCGKAGPKVVRALVDCMAGSSLSSVVATRPESIAAADAILASPFAADLLAEAVPDLLGGLPAHDGHHPTVPAVAEWARTFGPVLIDGHTGIATPPTLQEVPTLFAGLLRHCVASTAAHREAGTDPAASPVEPIAAAAVAEVRAWLPAEVLPEFDALLAEARSCYMLWDERVLHADASADGLTRLATLEIGSRLAARLALPDRLLAVEASPTQLRQALLDPANADLPALAKELGALRVGRLASRVYLAPAELDGGPPEPEQDSGPEPEGNAGEDKGKECKNGKGGRGGRALPSDDPSAYRALLATLSPEDAARMELMERYSSAVQKLLEPEPVDKAIERTSRRDSKSGTGKTARQGRLSCSKTMSFFS